MGKVMINNTNGKEDVERATLAFVVANAALTSGQEATVLLTVNGTWVATKGYTAGLQADGFAPLADVVTQFVTNGGTIWVCGACAKPRAITADMLVDGASLVGAATAVEAMVNGAQTLSF
ncbi:MAG: DsrE family protein [Anaerolineales bacterium]|nr:DsrE family protein [Anaerolineales bacterium]